jgi:AcrR family transcriptional regulator
VSDASETVARRPGRPASDAPDRILEAGLQVLKQDGYAGLTLAKVAAASGQNKALIAYYFGSKQGLVAAVARQVRELIIGEVLGGLGEPRTSEELVKGLVAGIWRLMEQDAGLQRVYFDLASQSVVEEEVRAIMRDMKEDFRAVLRQLLLALDDGPTENDADAAAVFLVAGCEGLSLEHLDRGDTPELSSARALFESWAALAISSK